MFDIGMSELLVIGIVALIVIGPKDLPELFHTLGRFTAKARSLGREFNRAMQDAARESGVNDIASDLKGVANPKKFGLDKLNQAADRFENWDPSAETSKTGVKGKPPERPKPDPEREADIAKIRAATEKAGQAKLGREAAAKAAEAAPVPAGDAEPAAKKPAAKKPAAKKPAAKKPAAKKPATKKPAAKKPAATKRQAAKPKPASGKADDA